jgi:hypothetical protein
VANDSTTDPRGKTPETWSSPEDARKNGGTYPNYWVRKTRSGHVMMLDDTKDNEHMTFQHRSGSMVQFMPDGAVQIVTHKGRYDITFGEQRVKVTGAQDTTVDGDASYKTGKNFNQTVYGDSIVSVKGAAVETAKNKNELFAEHIDVIAGSASQHTSYGTEISSRGPVTMSGRSGVVVGSSGGGVAVSSNKTTTIDSAAGTALKSDGPLEVKSAGGGQIKIEGDKVYINSGREAVVAQSTPAPSPSEEPDYTREATGAYTG